MWFFLYRLLCKLLEQDRDLCACAVQYASSLVPIFCGLLVLPISEDVLGFFGADVAKRIQHGIEAVAVDELLKIVLGGLVEMGHLLFSRFRVSMALT